MHNANAHITYIGHATTLITAHGHAVLTDPHFGRRVACLPRRERAHGYDAGGLPALSAICLTHTHIDHLHLGSYKYIASTVPIIVPPGTAGAIHPFVNNPIVELAHWIPHQVAPGLQITAVPVRHFGGRWIPGLRYRGVSAYVIQMGTWQAYCAGDSSYGTHFREVGNVYQLDLALLPCSGLVPRWLSPSKPLNALEVLQAWTDLKAKHLVPIHWGTFGRARMGDIQVERLRHLAAERDLGPRLHVLEPGVGMALGGTTG